MTMRWYRAKERRAKGTPGIRITPRGTVYFNAALTRAAKRFLHLPVAIGYDEEARQLAFQVAPATSVDTRTLGDCGHGTRRMHAIDPLRELGILPAEPIALPATVERDCTTEAWQIVATLPAAAPPTAFGPEAQAEIRDAEAAEALEEALDFEDQVELQSAPSVCSSSRERRTCEYCTFRRAGRCLNRESPRGNLRVGAAETCNQFARPQPPVDRSAPRSPGKRLRVRCVVCGTDQPMSKDRTPYAHDKFGTAYRAGRGDHRQPCPGNRKPGEPI